MYRNSIYHGNSYLSFVSISQTICENTNRKGIDEILWETRKDSTRVITMILSKLVFVRYIRERNMVRMHICMYTRMYLWSLELEKQEKQEKKGMERRGEESRGEERRGEERREEERREEERRGEERRDTRGYVKKEGERRRKEGEESKGWSRRTKGDGAKRSGRFGFEKPTDGRGRRKICNYNNYSRATNNYKSSLN